MLYRNSRMKLSAGQMFWREAGDRNRSIVIFLHGSWHDSSQWEEIVEPLSEDFHCFSLDLLGFGNSIPSKPSNMSIAVEVDCLHEFLSTLKLDSVYLVGHSLGAWIAIDYTLKYPDLVSGVVTISPEGFSLANWEKHSKLTLWLLAHPRLLRWWSSALELIVSISDGATHLEKMQTHWAFFRKFPTTCKLFFERSKRIVQSELVGDRLSEFSKPLLILQSDDEDTRIVEQSQAYGRSVQGAEYKWIENGELNLSTRSLRQITREIHDFVDRVNPQANPQTIQRQVE
jgi:pimeloyl-ACP methyl ester carboxylesterase